MVSGAWIVATAVAWAACGGNGAAAAFAPGAGPHRPLHGPGPLGVAAAPEVTGAPAPATAVDRATSRRRGAGPRRSVEDTAAADTLAPERRRSAPGAPQRIVVKGLDTAAARRERQTSPTPTAAVPAEAPTGVRGSTRRPVDVVDRAAPLNATWAPTLLPRGDTAHYPLSDFDRARRPDLRSGTVAAVAAPSEPARQGQPNRSRMPRIYRNSPSVPDSMVDFTAQIQRYRLLTAEEEQALGAKIQEAARLQRLREALEVRLARAPTEEEWCVAAGKCCAEEMRQAVEAGRLARDRLIVSNLRLVQKVVNMYLRFGLSPHYNAGDLMQAGVVALIRAADKFEPDRGWRFSTYALYWIRSRVQASEREQRAIIKFPPRVLLLSKKVARFQRDTYSAIGRPPTRQEICAALDISEEKLDRCYQTLKFRCCSLDEAMKYRSQKTRDESKGATLQDIIDGRELDQGYNRYDLDRLRDDMVRNMQRFLEPQDIELLLLRYGIKVSAANKRPSLRNGAATYADLHAKFGLSPSTAKKRIDRCLKKLKDMGYEEWLAYM